MLRDFDFVAMGDYHADMKESAEHAAAIIRDLSDKRRAVEKLLAVAVKAAGGEILIHSSEMHGLNPPGLEIWLDDANDCYHLRTVKMAKSARMDKR